MLSDKILCLKAFDANGEDIRHEDGWGYDRKQRGSNFWYDSNLRQRFHSEKKIVQYSHCPPNAQSVYNGYNAYDREAGFLYSFSAEDLKKIKTVTQKCNINSWETKRAGYCNGGTQELIYSWQHSNDYSQYYYQNVTDRIFLLNPGQADAVRRNFGTYLENAYPTESAIDNSDFQHEALSTNTIWPYWSAIPRNEGASYENLIVFGSVESLEPSNSKWHAYYGFYGVRPAFYLETNAQAPKTYTSTHGWCFSNNKSSFGYDADYFLDDTTYFATYGISPSALILKITKAIGLSLHLSSWGRCFGLSLLSLAQYYKLIDMKHVFSKEGDMLHDFGYEDILTNDNGEQWFSIANNKHAKALIERAHVAQDSHAFQQCQIFQNDQHYTALLDFLFSDDAKPIMTCLANHAMVVTTDMKPKKLENDWYQIPVYDSNAPSQSDLLINPTEPYRRGDSWLYVNTKSSEWKYYCDGIVNKQNNYYAFSPITPWNPSFQSISFYDVSKLDRSFFTDTLSLFFDVSDELYILKLVAPPTLMLDIFNDSGTLLFKFVNGQIEGIHDDCFFQMWYSGDDDMPIYTLYTKDPNLHIESNNADIIGLSNNHLVVAHVDSCNDINMDFSSGTITATASDANQKLLLAIQEFSTNRCITATGNVAKGENVTLSFSSDVLAEIANTTKSNIKYETDGVSLSNLRSECPRTGDNSNPCLWLLLVLASGCTLMLIFLHSPKRSRKDLRR